MLASQRAKETAAADANGKRRLVNVWPLGNAESVKQWVRFQGPPIFQRVRTDSCGSGTLPLPRLPNTMSFHS